MPKSKIHNMQFQLMCQTHHICVCAHPGTALIGFYFINRDSIGNNDCCFADVLFRLWTIGKLCSRSTYCSDFRWMRVTKQSTIVFDLCFNLFAVVVIINYFIRQLVIVWLSCNNDRLPIRFTFWINVCSFLWFFIASLHTN